ncbi:MAG: hypothetical protein IJL88_04610 [Clostridia bacterium]|nr:hypothetical protein [Clostridia bacterium]
MLYPHNSEREPDQTLFRTPGAEYRCAPFWAWNCDLDEGLLEREIDCMQQMGMGGFHMHTRCGMSVPYLSDEFMKKICFCADEAQKRHMLAWLYDEDKWPSGFAGGYVTEKKENRQRFLLLTPHLQKAEDGRLLARYSVLLDERGCLASYRRLKEGEAAEGQIWYALEQVTKPSPWFHFKGYVDTLNPHAIQDFIRITHERYRSVLGERLGTVCPAIFTDEPQLPRKTTLSRSMDLQDVILPWTGDLEETYCRAYGESLLEKLPEVIWELPEGVSLTRYRYHDHTTERFVSAYCDQIGDWCRRNGILMTGHMMDEGTLVGQTGAIGEAMRAYRGFTLPGVDQLCDGREFITVKQAASAAHQQGCPGVTSELYGVTNWDFDFKGHKLQGDWQATLGVSVRVPHLYWCSMHGESKRDYPASIGHQSSWWREYAYIEDHFARVNTLMTRGKPLIRIGVIHPIESCWIAYGPNDLTGRRRAELDRKFEEITKWLLFDTLDFDYICESTLPSLYQQGNAFRVGEMEYDVVIVPACETIRRTTLEALRSFRNRGGRVLFIGTVPKYVDAMPSEEASAFSTCCECFPWDRSVLNEELHEVREIQIEHTDGSPSDNLLCAIRRDGEGRNVLISHAMPPVRGAVDRQEEYRIVLRGSWKVSVWDTHTGEVHPADVQYSSDATVLSWKCWAQDSLLLRLVPAGVTGQKMQNREASLNGSYGIRMAEDFSQEKRERKELFLPPPDTIIPGEENVLVLDTAQWKTDGDEAWQPAEDMLRIGVAAKERLDISTAAVSGAQPWILPPETTDHTLSLRIVFFSEIEISSVRVALEDADRSEVRMNGMDIDRTRAGWFADEAITCWRAGPVHRGENILEISKPIAASTCTENVFLLGDFGVRVCGSQAVLIPAPRTLQFGDWTTQGFPFYSGPMTYRFRLQGGRRLRLRLGRFSAPCVTADLDGKRIANLSLAPSEADFGLLTEGEHVLDLTLYASRINSFGTFHLNDESTIWFGPMAWRSTGMRWTKTYRLARSGLLSEPQLFEY